MAPRQPPESDLMPVVDMAEIPDRDAFRRIKGAGLVVHAAGLYEGPGDDRRMARCCGAFFAATVTYPSNDELVTCFWCIAQRQEWGLRW